MGKRSAAALLFLITMASLASALAAQVVTAGGPDTSALAGAGSFGDRLARLVGRLEAMERGQGGGPPPELSQIVGADRRARAYAESHPDDRQLLILAARMGRLRHVAQPLVFTPNNPPTLVAFDTAYAPYHAFRRQALAIAPPSAEAHYWQARLHGMSFTWRRLLYGFEDLPDSAAGFFHPRTDSALRHARRAVELAPQEVPYREALALFLVAAGQPDEAATVLRDVAGGRHPIRVLLTDRQTVPPPPGATEWSSQARLFTSMLAGWEYADLRVRAYVVPGPAAPIEAFYRRRWPSLRFFDLGDEGDAPGVRSLGQVLRVTGTTLTPTPNKSDLGQSFDGLPDGFVLMLMEMTGAGEEARSQLPLPVGDVFCVLTILDIRRLR